jgi:hypothetical protein
MKLTRKQLRRLINEIRIKPNIPSVPSEDALGKIDDLARSQDFKDSANVMSHTFGYPEDRSYVEDLKDYDDVVNIPRTEQLYDEIVQIIISIYDQEVHNFSLDRLIYDEMNSSSDSDFDKFLKRLARDIYTYMSKKYAGSGIPHPFEHSVIIKGGSGISRIYQALKNVK